MLYLRFFNRQGVYYRLITDDTKEQGGFDNTIFYVGVMLRRSGFAYMGLWEWLHPSGEKATLSTSPTVGLS